jgi:ribosomal RNA-processing protein 36
MTMTKFTIMARYVARDRSREVGDTSAASAPELEEYSSGSDDEGGQVTGHVRSDGNSDSEASSSSDDDGKGDDGMAQDQLNHVSFGALSRAQDAIGGQGNRKRKRDDEKATSVEQKSKLAAMRERLQELRERKEGKNDRGKDMSMKKGKGEEAQRPKAFFTNGANDDANDSDSEDSDSDNDSISDVSLHGDSKTRYKRSSKHAPTAMPANRAVGRYREVVEVPKSKARDPRFDVTSGNLDRNAIQSRYSFLNNYQTDELTSLKKALKDPKAKLSADQREKLQRKMVSLESKVSASKAREREEKVRREHRKQEREAVAQGKKPFYLKKSDVKKQALVDRFEGMKSRQKDKVIQRRRKKLAAKERKDMPMDRRV